MGKSFEEQYPDYKLIPEKKRRWVWALVWIFGLGTLIAVPLSGLWVLSKMNVPTPAEVGLNDFSIGTLGNIAESQSREGAHALAVRSFTDYFRLGGDNPEHMATFAASLSALGRQKEALEWSRKAVKAAPQSKAAQFINQSLESKNQTAH